MPVERIALDSRLLARYQVGTDEHGDPVYRSRTLARIKTDSEDQNLWDMAYAIAGLQTYPIAEVRRVDNSEILEVI